MAANKFSDSDNIELARLVLKKFGNPAKAAAAWSRLHGSKVAVIDFVKLAWRGRNADSDRQTA